MHGWKRHLSAEILGVPASTAAIDAAGVAAHPVQPLNSVAPSHKSVPTSLRTHSRPIFRQSLPGSYFHDLCLGPPKLLGPTRDGVTYACAAMPARARARIRIWLGFPFSLPSAHADAALPSSRKHCQYSGAACRAGNSGRTRQMALRLWRGRGEHGPWAAGCPGRARYHSSIAYLPAGRRSLPS